jgi:hypothetical protein
MDSDSNYAMASVLSADGEISNLRFHRYVHAFVLTYPIMLIALSAVRGSCSLLLLARALSISSIVPLGKRRRKFTASPRGWALSASHIMTTAYWSPVNSNHTISATYVSMIIAI